jgi:hypothetical protein
MADTLPINIIQSIFMSNNLFTFTPFPAYDRYLLPVHNQQDGGRYWSHYIPSETEAWLLFGCRAVRPYKGGLKLSSPVPRGSRQ